MSPIPEWYTSIIRTLFAAQRNRLPWIECLCTRTRAVVWIQAKQTYDRTPFFLLPSPSRVFHTVKNDDEYH